MADFFQSRTYFIIGLQGNIANLPAVALPSLLLDMPAPLVPAAPLIETLALLRTIVAMNDVVTAIAILLCMPLLLVTLLEAGMVRMATPLQRIHVNLILVFNELVMNGVTVNNLRFFLSRDFFRRSDIVSNIFTGCSNCDEHYHQD